MFYGLGSDGTVGANKNSIKIIGDHTDMYARVILPMTLKSPRFDGISPALWQDPYPLDISDRLCRLYRLPQPCICHTVRHGSPLKKGCTFSLNCQWAPEELDAHLPAKMKQLLAKKEAKLYIIDATDLAAKLAGQLHKYNNAGCIL